MQLPGFTQDECMETTIVLELNPENVPIGQFPELAGNAFQTKFWREANVRHFELSTVHRQKDIEIVTRLRELREGRVTTQGLAFWSNLERDLPASAVEPTHLYPCNAEVDRTNTRRLADLDARTEQRYKCVDCVKVNEGAPHGAEEYLRKDEDFFDKNHLVPKELVLRKGAQVYIYIYIYIYKCMCKCMYVCVYIYV
jgi:hypothetical protein